MTTPNRDAVLIQLDRVDTALESPEADKAAVMRDAEAWIAANPSLDSGDALYYRERLQAIRDRHGVG